MDYIYQVCLIALILTYGIFLARLIPSKYHFASNIGFCILLIVPVLLAGYDFQDLGMGSRLILKGIFVAIGASLVIMGILYTATRIKFARRLLLGQKSILNSSSTHIAYETSVRIPLSTALAEEIIFRGVLLGVLLSYHSNLIAILISSVVFGFWHVFPAINTMNANYFKKQSTSDYLKTVIGNVAATSVAGAFFAWLRIISGSIIAPWLVHWTINSSAVLSVVIAGKKQKTKK